MTIRRVVALCSHAEKKERSPFDRSCERIGGIRPSIVSGGAQGLCHWLAECHPEDPVLLVDRSRTAVNAPLDDLFATFERQRKLYGGHQGRHAHIENGTFLLVVGDLYEVLRIIMRIHPQSTLRNALEAHFNSGTAGFSVTTGNVFESPVTEVPPLPRGSCLPCHSIMCLPKTCLGTAIRAFWRALGCLGG